MNPITIFNAYKLAQLYKRMCIGNRGTDRGILVDKDHFALLYQKLDRQVDKFEERLVGILSEIQTALFICPDCGYKVMYNEFISQDKGE